MPCRIRHAGAGVGHMFVDFQRRQRCQIAAVVRRAEFLEPGAIEREGGWCSVACIPGEELGGQFVYLHGGPVNRAMDHAAVVATGIIRSVPRPGKWEESHSRHSLSIAPSGPVTFTGVGRKTTSRLQRATGWL